MDIGRANPPDKPLRHEGLEFVRPGFGVKVGKAGSLCMYYLNYQVNSWDITFCTSSTYLIELLFFSWSDDPAHGCSKQNRDSAW